MNMNMDAARTLLVCGFVNYLIGNGFLITSVLNRIPPWSAIPNLTVAFGCFIAIFFL